MQSGRKPAVGRLGLCQPFAAAAKVLIRPRHKRLKAKSPAETQTRVRFPRLGKKQSGGKPLKMNKRTKFTKLTALVLSIMFVLGSLVTAVSAADGSRSSVTDKTLEDVKILLNATSYDE